MSKTFRMHEEIVLNQYEEKLLKIVNENPGINDKKATELSGFPKETTTKYLKRLQEYRLLEFQILKQNEKAWFVATKTFPSYEEFRKNTIEDFEIRELEIKKSLKLVENRSKEEIISTYKAAYDKIFRFQNFLTFIITTNKFKKHPKHWLDLQKRVDDCLEELAKGVDDKIWPDVMFHLALKDSKT